MPVGIVQFFLDRKGFGYIQIPVTKEEFYVQRKHLLTPVRNKDKVHFVVKEDGQGLYATEVKVVKE